MGGGRFDMCNKIGAGAFGEVWSANDLCQTNRQVAVKVAKIGALENEVQILRSLNSSNTLQGFTDVIAFCSDSCHSFLVVDLLGESLDQLFRRCSSQFQLSTVVLVAKQVLLRIEYLHSKGIVHRDIKPENFVMGLGGKIHHVHLIDFGLSKAYFDGQHIGMATGLELAGTPRYASINTHKGVVQSRRDDLEAIGYMLMHFLRGCLPWSGIRVRHKDPFKSSKLLKVLELKESTKPRNLCQGFPDEFEVYLKYCKKLGFQSAPDYTMLRQLFEDVSAREGPFEDHAFEWLKGTDVAVQQLEPLLPQSSSLQQPDALMTRETGANAPASHKSWIFRLAGHR